MALSKMFKSLPSVTLYPTGNKSPNLWLQGNPADTLILVLKQNSSEFSFLGKELVTLKLPNSSLNQEFQRNLKLAVEILISAQSFPPS